MINPQWLEQPIYRTIFHGPKAVRAIEVRLYIHLYCIQKSLRLLNRLTDCRMSSPNH